MSEEHKPLSADEMERERAAFEAWMYEHWSDGMCFCNAHAWEAWQARAADAQRLLAQRDAQLAEVEDDYVQIIAAQDEKHRVQLAALRQHKNDYMEAAEGTRRALNARIAELEALEVVLPAAKGMTVGGQYALGWNAALVQVARLNAKPQANSQEAEK